MLTAFISVMGRAAIVTIFLLVAFGNKIPNYNNVAAIMGREGVPAPQILLAGAIVFLIVGGVSVLLGFKARIGASLLLIFLILATYYFHDFWTIADPARRQQELIQFVKNLSIMGTMIFIIANGPGAGSVEVLFLRKSSKK